MSQYLPPPTGQPYQPMRPQRRPWWRLARVVGPVCGVTGGLLGLLLGAGIGAAGSPTTTAAPAPAPTLTVTRTVGGEPDANHQGHDPADGEACR